MDEKHTEKARAYDEPGAPSAEPDSGAPVEIDATGLLCPLPVLRLRKALGAAPAGTRVRLLATDPASRIDVPHFCNETGHRLMEAGEAPKGCYVYLVEAR